MQNEENTLDTQEATQASETVEETVQTEPADENSDETGEVLAKLAEAQAEAAKYRRLFEKAQKPSIAVKVPQVTPQPNVEETVLLANGMSEELLNELKVLAQVRKTTLIKAQNDPIFVAMKEKFEKDQKTKEASVGASRGAGGTKVQKNFNTPGLSRDDHRAMVLGK